MQHSPRLDGLSGDSLRRLHRGAIGQPGEIRALLERARSEHVALGNGVDRRSDPRSAWIAWVGSDRLRLDAPNLRAQGQPQIYLHFELGAARYFFAAPPIGGGGDRPLDLELPAAIYEAERRDLRRVPAAAGEAAPRIRLSRGDRAREGRLRDASYQGMAVALPAAEAADLGPGEALQVEVLDGERAGERGHARVRHRSPDRERHGWTQLGLEVSAVASRPEFPVEERARILDGGFARRAWRRLSLAGAVARTWPERVRRAAAAAGDEALEVVEYANQRGEAIRGLVDRACGGRGGTAVVIPPAWGRTKESFLALAQTLTATFAQQGEPLSVLRFDGTHRRGESYIDPECRASGDEYLHFRFSRAVEDIRASFDFVRREPGIAPERIVLVSFSLGAIEGRRALVEEAGAIDGWVSVVGMVDLQSGLRTVSGGVDYAYGQSLGLRFGRHELVGVVADMDWTGDDAFRHGLVFLEDARRDMAELDLPITWIHGRHDAWMDLERVRALLAAGPPERRRLIEVPAGHQMRSSREAIETFQLVAAEVAAMALGRSVEPALPDLARIEERTRAERSRRPKPALDRRAFWSDYLLGRDRRLGFELMSATTAYRALMRRQIEGLELAAGDHLVDLGAGTGDLPLLLSDPDGGAPAGLRVTEVDLVPQALARGRERLARSDSAAAAPQLERVAADLEIAGAIRGLPLAAGSADAVMASLVLSYVTHPLALLREIRALLRPGGRLVLSSMRRDADISRIYVASLAELPPDRRRVHFGREAADDFDELQRVFLNDAARLMQLEEEGRFRFFDAPELEQLVRRAGLEPVSSERGFGDPPQAVVLRARRPA